jgi:HAD superfamily hydrolase (TIGR01509 family)
MRERMKVSGPRALLLDMDGTLTEPMLDFAGIRREMGIGEGEPILEAMAGMDLRRMGEAEKILLRHEEAAAVESVLARGCGELLEWAANQKVRTALVTRNSGRSATTVLRRHRIAVDAIVSREDRPFKPHPAAVHLACRRLSIEPAEAWMIGDGPHDIEAGVAAGIRTVWVSLGRERNFAAAPWRSVVDLGELLGLLGGMEWSCER